MGRLLSRIGLPVLGIGLLAVLLLVGIHPLVPVSKAATTEITHYLDFPATWNGSGWVIPANCSNWHELYPTLCMNHHQWGYEDTNQDGLVSVCDNIIETPYALCWHIDAVMTTYFFSPVQGGSQHTGESSRHPGEGPICDNWHIISDYSPFYFCQSVHIDDWYDANGNGILDVCDNVLIGGIWYHIDGVGCDVQVSNNPVTATRGGTWGWLKGLFHRK